MNQHSKEDQNHESPISMGILAKKPVTRIWFFIIYFAIAASFLAHRVIYIQLPDFRLSPYRISLVLLVFGLIVELWKKEITLSELFFPKKSRFSIWVFIIWSLYAILSVFWVYDRGEWFRDVFFITSGTFMIVFLNAHLNSIDKIKRALIPAVIMLAFHNTVSWYEIITRNYHFVTEPNAVAYAKAAKRVPISTLTNPNDLAMALMFGIVFATILFLVSKRIRYKVFLGLLVFSSLILLIQTNSRANVLGFIMGILFVSLLFLKMVRLRFRFLSIFIMLMGIIILEAQFGLFSHIWHSYFNSLSGNSESTRVNLLKNGLVFLKETWGLGVGAGNIEYWMENFSVYPTGRITNIHNWWGELLTGYGIIVTSLYLLFYMLLFYSMYTKYNQSNNVHIKIFSAGFMTLMVMFILSSVSSSSNIIRDWLWVSWGIVIAFQNLESEIDNG
jgi:teichuronic acid biosynthesis protein TuaE